jgi:hypothetical protein
MAPRLHQLTVDTVKDYLLSFDISREIALHIHEQSRLDSLSTIL